MNIYLLLKVFFVLLCNLLTFFVAIWVMLEILEIENLKEFYLSFKRAERD